MLRLILSRIWFYLKKVFMKHKMESSNKQMVVQFVYLGASLVSSWLLMKWIISEIDPSKENKKRLEIQKAILQRRLGRSIDTDNHEMVIATDVINPCDIDIGMDDIGGLEETKKTLWSKVVLPVKQPQLFQTFLLRQAKGVLLYGPPGTGKTMLAKALARDAGCNFMNIKASSLQSKWFGETQKLVQAVFTLAYKLQPCIIFIDEVDALLGKRRETEHEATTTLKTEFMQLWDGFCTDAKANVMVLAATNRPYELDEAVLRRFSLQLEVGMPNAKQREAILKLYLDRQVRDCQSSRHGGISVERNLAKNIAEEDGRKPLARLAEQTEGFNGSDLLELCSRAAALTVQEHLETEQSGESSSVLRSGTRGSPGRVSPVTPQDMSLRHFTKVLQTFRPSTHAAEAYRNRLPQSGLQGADFLNMLASSMQYAPRGS